MITNRLIINKLGKLKVAYLEETNYKCDQTVRIIAKWCDIQDVNTRSINISLSKYANFQRDELEKISTQFDYKYLLGICY